MREKFKHEGRRVNQAEELAFITLGARAVLIIAPCVDHQVCNARREKEERGKEERGLTLYCGHISNKIKGTPLQADDMTSNCYSQSMTPVKVSFTLG